MTNVRRPRVRFTSRVVPKRESWTRAELSGLRQFLHDHEGVSWKTKAKLWYRQYGIRRTGEGLRGKLNYLNRLADDALDQRAPSAPRTLEPIQSVIGPDMARLESVPTSTAEHTETSEYPRARQNLPPLDHVLRGCRTLPSINFSTRSGHPRFDDPASAPQVIEFEELLDLIFTQWLEEHIYRWKGHLR